VTELDPGFAADADPLAGLGATAGERIAFYQALDEQQAEEWADARAAAEDLGEDLGDEDGGDGYGPWRDEAALLEEIGGQVDDHVTRAAVTAEQDSEDAVWYARRPSAEARAARALDRIGSGTYTTPEYYRGGRDTTGRYASACGEPDDFGRCSARFHSASCHVVTDEAAATGSAEEAEAWSATLTAYQQPPGVAGAEELGLANPADPQPGTGDMWADLIDPAGEPGSATPGLHARLLHYMGEADAPARPPRDDLPDVTGLREELGLR
jgi:hypothetical protein